MTEYLVQEPLPPGWSYCVTEDGRVFFVDDHRGVSTWLHPDFNTPLQTGHLASPDLPLGFEYSYTPEGAKYYIETKTKDPFQRNATFRKSGKSKVHSTTPTMKRNANAPISMLGWLNRLELGGSRSWKRRWSIISEFCIYFYKDQSEKQEKGSILLPSYSVRPCTLKDYINKPFAFKIEHENMKTNVFTTDTAVEFNDWLNAFQLSTSAQHDFDKERELNNNQPSPQPFLSEQQLQGVPPQKDSFSRDPQENTRRSNSVPPSAESRNNPESPNDSWQFNSGPRYEESYLHNIPESVSRPEAREARQRHRPDSVPVNYRPESITMHNRPHSYSLNQPESYPEAVDRPNYVQIPSRQEAMSSRRSPQTSLGESRFSNFTPDRFHSGTPPYNTGPDLINAGNMVDDRWPDSYRDAHPPTQQHGTTDVIHSPDDKGGANLMKKWPDSMEIDRMHETHPKRDESEYAKSRTNDYDKNTFPDEYHQQQSPEWGLKYRPKIRNLDAKHVEGSARSDRTARDSRDVSPVNQREYAKRLSQIDPVYIGAHPRQGGSERRINDPSRDFGDGRGNDVALNRDDSGNFNQSTANIQSEATTSTPATYINIVDAERGLNETPTRPPLPASFRHQIVDDLAAVQTPKTSHDFKMAVEYEDQHRNQPNHFRYSLSHTDNKPERPPREIAPHPDLLTEMRPDMYLDRNEQESHPPRAVESMTRPSDEYAEVRRSVPDSRRSPQSRDTRDRDGFIPAGVADHPPPQSYHGNFMPSAHYSDQKYQPTEFDNSPEGGSFGSADGFKRTGGNYPDSDRLRPKSQGDGNFRFGSYQHDSGNFPNEYSAKFNRDSGYIRENAPYAQQKNTVYPDNVTSGYQHQGLGPDDHYHQTGFIGSSPPQRPNRPVNKQLIQTVQEETDMSPADILETKSIFPNYPLGTSRLRMSLTADNLLGKSHEELILLLIQLRRTKAGLEQARDFYRRQLEKIREQEMEYRRRSKEGLVSDVNLEQQHNKYTELRSHSDDIDTKLEVYKPLINLVDNMVTMGSLYGGDNYMLATQYKKHLLRPDQYTPPKKMLEFSRHHQEDVLLRDIEEDNKKQQLTEEEANLEEKMGRLYELDRACQEQAAIMGSLKEDKDLLERALADITKQITMSKDSPRDVEYLSRQQRDIHQELSRAMQQLADASKKLEETSAENRIVEQEVAILRGRLNATDQGASKSAPSLGEETTQARSRIERDLARVGGMMAGLSEESEKLKSAMDSLLSPDQQPSPVDGIDNRRIKSKSKTTYYETDLDTLNTSDIALSKRHSRGLSTDLKYHSGSTTDRQGDDLNKNTQIATENSEPSWKRLNPKNQLRKEDVDLLRKIGGSDGRLRESFDNDADVKLRYDGFSGERDVAAVPRGFHQRHHDYVNADIQHEMSKSKRVSTHQDDKQNDYFDQNAAYHSSKYDDDHGKKFSGDYGIGYPGRESSGKEAMRGSQGKLYVLPEKHERANVRYVDDRVRSPYEVENNRVVEPIVHQMSSTSIPGTTHDSYNVGYTSAQGYNDQSFGYNDEGEYNALNRNDIAERAREPRYVSENVADNLRFSDLGRDGLENYQKGLTVEISDDTFKRSTYSDDLLKPSSHDHRASNSASQARLQDFGEPLERNDQGGLVKDKARAWTIRDVKRQSEQRRDRPLKDDEDSTPYGGEVRMIEPPYPGSNAPTDDAQDFVHSSFNQPSARQPLYENIPRRNDVTQTVSEKAKLHASLPSIPQFVSRANGETGDSSKTNFASHSNFSSFPQRRLGPKPFTPYAGKSPANIGVVAGYRKVEWSRDEVTPPKLKPAAAATLEKNRLPDQSRQPRWTKDSAGIPETSTHKVKRSPRRGERYMTISSSQPVTMETPVVKADIMNTAAGDLIQPVDMIPDIVRSSTTRSDLFDANVIDRELLRPQKVKIPERYIPDVSEDLTEEEKLWRQERSDRIRKLLTSSSLHDLSKSDSNLAGSRLHEEVNEWKKEREQLLALNQQLARQVTQKTRQTAEAPTVAVAPIPVKRDRRRIDHKMTFLLGEVDSETERHQTLMREQGDTAA